MKKIISLLLAAVMLFSLGINAAAYNVTMTTTEGHSYTAYQVFKGTLTEVDGSKILSDVEWGNGVNGAALLAALKADHTYGTVFADCESAADVADVLATYNDDSVAIAAIAKVIAANKTTAAGSGEGTIEDLAAGYYLILDTTNTNSMPEGETYSDFILEVVSNVEVTAKDDSVTSQKKVKDTNDSTGVVDDWQDSADHDIGDSVPFQLKATIAEDYDKYETYKLIFHDKECEGLTFNNDAKVFVDGTQINGGFTVNTPASDGDTFDVVFTDLKTIANVKAGSVITVEYTSILNDKAAIGAAGNPNEMYVEYSNNPNADVDGIEDTTGKTPLDKVIVFTYQVNINKIDEKGAPLQGASFELFKKIGGEWTSLGKIDGAELSTFTWKGIDDGDYKLVETEAPRRYNSIEDIEFTVTAEHDTLSDDPELKSLNGGNKFSGDIDTGVLSTDIENKQGNTLPSTGGIGTTIFYVLGGLLVAFAAILLITKKRMDTRG